MGSATSASATSGRMRRLGETGLAPLLSGTGASSPRGLPGRYNQLHGYELPPGRPMSRHLVASLALLLQLTTSAQDKAPATGKQKEFAAESMKKAEVKDARVRENQNLG